MTHRAARFEIVRTDAAQPEHGDALELRRFSDFLAEAGPPPGAPGFSRARFHAAYKTHYPEEFARAVAELEAKETP